MTTKTVELEMDAIAKLEAARWSAGESLSAVVRRATFAGKPHVARELLDDFPQRAGHSPLSEDTLQRLHEAQAHPVRSNPLNGFALELRGRIKYAGHMPMTLDQIVEEARQLPTEQVAELVDRLSEGLYLSSGIEESWKVETRRRVADIEAGKVQGIPGNEVSARIRKIVGR